MRNTHETDLSRGPMLGKLISVALPMALAGILQLAFNAADLVIIGRFAGEQSMAAVGSNSSLISLVVNVLVGLSSGASVLSARYFGARDSERMRETVSTTLIVALVGGALFGIVGFIAAEPMLKMMSTPDDVLPLAVLYLRIYFCGLPVMALYNYCAAIMRSVGDTKRPLYYLACAGILNVLLNIFFVVVCRMDVSGVALATVISQALSACLTLRCILLPGSFFHVALKDIKFSGRQLAGILRIGIPAGIQGSLFSVSNVIIQSSVNSFGSLVMAGNSAANTIEGFCFCGQDAIAQCAMAAVSQNMGAREYGRTRSAIKISAAMEVIFSLAIFAVIVPLREVLLGLFTSDAGAIEAGSIRLIILGFTFFTDGLMLVLSCSLRGLGFGLAPALMTLIGACGFRIVWVYTIFAAYPTLENLYISYPITWSLTSIAQLIFYLAMRKKAYRKNELKYA